MVIIGIAGLVWWSKSSDDRELSASSGVESTVNPEAKEKISFKQAIGKKAPDFELESIDGKTIKLSDYLGKNVVLFFNEGSMCYPACWSQMAELGNDSRFETENIVAFSIVTDPRSQWLDIVSKSANLGKSKILFDTSRSVSKAYDVLYLNSSMHPGSLPGHTYFIIDKEGTIRFTMDDPNMALANDKLIKQAKELK
ncbi:MAG: Alkyl hydroperoxide reductase/ Thiol specific antioxidant/ Mal allergen [Candidatus Nomurabacteria bacterium GW2011_GWF1_42_40]|nr:MAG: Alkyl hydroperoxide reductase/ Thiol specific antioxidant/ Mal allergen [Candidatus Nomurabacteria bacterium GW2011_GWF1_42_40]